MVSDEFQGGKSQTTVHNQAAYLKAQQIAQQNAAVQQQRQQAPSGLSADSPQYQQVKAAEAKAAQQAYVSGQFQQKGSTSDKYASAREAALQSGRFDYGSYGQQVPQSFVTSKGIRTERPTIPMVQGAQTTPQGTAPVITISARQLQRTNAARASQGLPPLETVMRVDIVKPTPKTPDYRSQVAQALGQAQGLLGQAQGSEVSSFLKFPFAGQKVQSQNIPSTSLADLFAFVPIGAGSISKGAIEAGKEISGFFTKTFAREAPGIGESIVRTGGADIGTNIPKYTEKFRTEKNIQSMIQQRMKTPPPEMARQAPLPSTTEVSLGTGTGRQISSNGGKISKNDIFKPTSPTRPSPAEKTVSAGRGLEQIVKQEEKQVTKTIQKQKPEFEQRQAQKQEKYLRDQEQKTEQIQKQEQIQKEAQTTRQEQVQKTEQSLLQKTGLRYVKTSTPQEQKQTSFPLIQIPKQKPKQTQRQTPVFLIPKPEPKPQPFPTVQITKPKQTPKFDLGGIYIPTFATPPPPTRTPPPPPPPVLTPPPPSPPPTETPPPTKRPPPEFGLLGTGGAPGMLGKVSKYGARREFIGNVPIADIVGVYGSRSEISYGGGGARQTSKELSKAATGKFIQSTRKKVF